MPSQRTTLRILLTAAAVFYLVFIWRTSFQAKNTTYFTLVDDAMISMRYGRSLAQGDGLVWNPGQPPVEGFTNLGWTLVLAGIHALPVSQAHISLVVMLFSAALLLAAGVVIYQIVLVIEPASRLAAMAASTAVLFYFPLVFWSLRGLEVGLLVLVLMVSLMLALRITKGFSASITTDSMWLALALASAILIRMDAIIPAFLLVTYLAFKAGRHAILPGMVSLLVLAAVLLFQKSYYGDFLPNTYYLKVAGVSAWERIRTGLLSLNDYALRDFAMPLFVGILGMLLFRQLRSHESFLLLGLFVAQVGYSLWVGGDYAEELVDSANRFITQGMPALIILLALVLEKLALNTNNAQEQKQAGTWAWTASPVTAVLLGLAAVVVMSGEPWFKWGYMNAPMLRSDIQRAQIGLHIAGNTDPAAVIAVHAAGQIPYFSDRTTIDLLGKSDPLIAKSAPVSSFTPGHNKWNYQYSILELRPDVIADNFNKLRGFMQDQETYIQLPNGLYVRQDTRLVDFDGLGEEYR